MVLNQPSEPTEDAEIAPVRIRMDPPFKAEIIQALKEMKNNKAARIAGIPVETLKTNLNVIADALMPLFNDIWTFETIPDD